MPTSLYFVRPDELVHLLPERPPTDGGFGAESFNVDPINNRREMVAHLFAEDGQRAALIRSRSTPRAERHRP
jgi:hypothetical protein